MDLYIFNLLNGLSVKYPALDPLFAFMGDGLAYVTIVFLFYFLLVHKDKKRGAQELLMMVGVAGFAWFAAHFFKSIFDTVRPFVAMAEVTPLFPQDADGAFPSGHATFFSALATMMWFYHKRIAMGLVIIALVIGFGRVISGVHFPGDILGGYVLGSAIAVTMYFLTQKFFGTETKEKEN